jgi:tRNA uridine 5-carboxymethylaminomethyl modification enzyme
MFNSLVRETSVSPEEMNVFLNDQQSSMLKQKVKLIDVIARPEIDLRAIMKRINLPWYKEYGSLFYFNEVAESVEIEIKYKGYLDRERLLAEKVARLDGIKIDKNIDIDSLVSISTEGRFKLKKYKPDTIGQAVRISGISPSDINVLLIYMGR